jgi:hypothetical protein
MNRFGAILYGLAIGTIALFFARISFVSLEASIGFTRNMPGTRSRLRSLAG